MATKLPEYVWVLRRDRAERAFYFLSNTDAKRWLHRHVGQKQRKQWKLFPADLISIVP
jgi:hypothetical protein